MASGSESRQWGTCHHVATLQMHRGAIRSVVFGQEEEGTVLTGSMDGTAQLWDVVQGARLHTLTGHKEGVRAVALSPSGALAATASYDRTCQ
eukprot:CAMPEP_0182892794 /NCGR_PEP_ID=MMETSP0034_2-20130328/24092_1 /TAXON_ID=156128 /ORGANISM="Nephroselmis pyriformis, Strain CCMP717" /LENGTH=91 /DNA_ID=CAMNT_0025026501 /DNA_START=3 /DNA_END=275 /DNA_ORIENTATION=+